MDEDIKYIGKKEKFSYGLAAVGSYMISNVIASYLQIFLTDVLIVPPVFILILMVFARFWDMANDPIMGVIIDKTNTPAGKMRPYIQVGAFLIFAVSVLIFLPISNAPSWLKMIFAAIMYLAFDTAYTIVDVPAMGLMSVATPNRKERAALLSFYVTIGSIGTVLPIGLMSVFGTFISERWVYFAVAAITGVIIFVGYSLLYRNSKERFAMHSEKVKVKDMLKTAIKNKPMLLTLLTSMVASPRYLIMLAAAYIATYVIQIPGISADTMLLLLYVVVGGGMFVGILITPPIYKKIGYKRTSIIFGIVGGVFLGATFFVGFRNYYAALPLMVIGGLALGAYNVLPYPMVGDSLDYLEWKTGKRMEGVCFSLNSFVTKFNNAIGAIMLSVGIIIFKFVQPEVSGVPLPQSEFTLNGLFAMVTLIPAIFFFLSIIPMAFNTFTGKRKEQILEELAERRALAEQTQQNAQEPLAATEDTVATGTTDDVAAVTDEDAQQSAAADADKEISAENPNPHNAVQNGNDPHKAGE